MKMEDGYDLLARSYEIHMHHTAKGVTVCEWCKIECRIFFSMRYSDNNGQKNWHIACSLWCLGQWVEHEEKKEDVYETCITDDSGKEHCVRTKRMAARVTSRKV